MTITLRPACSADYPFALRLYVQTIKPLAITWMEWVDTNQEAQFASLWRQNDTRIITLDGQEDIGWVEFRTTGDEVFLKQFYISPEHQRRGLGSQVMRLLLKEQRGAARSMALFVLKSNPASRFYQRHGFDVVQETPTRFVMRREIAEAETPSFQTGRAPKSKSNHEALWVGSGGISSFSTSFRSVG
jgi:ribosomal protein S18 acetylase RimI-like enzyme